MTILNLLRAGLVVSCQPVDDGPMDHPDIVAAMAGAAVNGGAAGLRIEGIKNLVAVRPVTNLPVIGIIKRDLSDSPVRITPFADDVSALAMAGADIIAYDATQRARPTSTKQLVEAIHAAGRLAMADCARAEDGEQALVEAADILGTTLSGYAYKIRAASSAPDFELISRFKAMGGFVMAEGRINSPALAAGARRAGADCVTVGSAITRIEHATSWFVDVMARKDEI